MEYAKVLLGLSLFIALCGLGSSTEDAALPTAVPAVAPSAVPPVALAVDLVQVDASAPSDTDAPGARKVRQFFGPPPPPPFFGPPPPPPPFGYGGFGGGYGGGYGGGFGGSYQRTRVVTRTRYRGGGFGGGFYG